MNYGNFQWPIARGRISHSVWQEVKFLSFALTRPLTNEGKVRSVEEAFAAYVGRETCIVFPFARTALHATLSALDLSPGEKILLPALTIKPFLDVVRALGLAPVFVDVDLTSGSFDLESLEDALLEKPRVAVLTYLFGVVPDISALSEILAKNSVFIVEDFSQNLNSEWNGSRAGNFGDVSIFSSSSVKTFDTFGGGFLLTDSGEFEVRLRSIRDELRPPSRANLVKKILVSLMRNLATQRWIFGLLTWPLLQIMDRLGQRGLSRFAGTRDTKVLDSLPEEWFRKFTSVQATAGIELLPMTAGRDRRRATIVQNFFAGEPIGHWVAGHPDGNHVHWQRIVLDTEDSKFQERLRSLRIDSGKTSLSLLSKLKSYGYDANTPNAVELHQRGLYVPCYDQLSASEITRIDLAFEASDIQ